MSDASRRQVPRRSPFALAAVRWLLLSAALAASFVAGAAYRPQELPGKTDLMRAAHRGQVLRVAQLLREGADVNARNGNGGTALMYAALGGHAEVIDVLLREGARWDLSLIHI